MALTWLWLWCGLVQVALRNPVILRTKVFPTSSNFRRSRRPSFARPSGMLAIWKSTLGGCRPSDKGLGGGGGAFGPQFGPKILRGGGGYGGSPGFATGVSYYFWCSLVVLAQRWDLWSLLFTIQLFYSQNTETETNDNTRGKLDKATVFTDTTYEIKTCPSRRFFPFVWLKRDRYGTRTWSTHLYAYLKKVASYFFLCKWPDPVVG